MEKFEEKIHSDLKQYLLNVNEIDERLPECPKQVTADSATRDGYRRADTGLAQNGEANLQDSCCARVLA